MPACRVNERNADASINKRSIYNYRSALRPWLSLEVMTNSDLGTVADYVAEPGAKVDDLQRRPAYQIGLKPTVEETLRRDAERKQVASMERGLFPNCFGYWYTSRDVKEK